MSAVATTESTVRPSGAAPDRKPTLTRLTQIELRKMVDTRSGFWVSMLVAGLMVAVAVLTMLVHGGAESTTRQVFSHAAQPAGLLLPVIGVLLITGEFSQRTALVTFTLTPDRLRVLAAKAFACLVVATMALVLAALAGLALAPLGHAAGGAGPLPVQLFAQGWLYLCLQMLMGLGFGAATLVSAPAVVTFLLLPTIANAVLTGFPALGGVYHWVDPEQTLLPMIKWNLSGADWEHAAVTAAVWILVPLVFGALRIRRRDL